MMQGTCRICGAHDRTFCCTAHAGSVSAVIKAIDANNSKFFVVSHEQSIVTTLSRVCALHRKSILEPLSRFSDAGTQSTSAEMHVFGIENANPRTSWINAHRSGKLARILVVTICALSATFGAGRSKAEAIIDFPGVKSFIGSMVERHGFDRAKLEDWFRQAAFQPAVIRAISRPAEAKPWYQYRRIFLTETRIQGGVRYWRLHASALSAAQSRFRVPPEMILAIIGVETSYGENSGSYRVLDALATLAFDYPRRADFFRRELEEFLLLCREEGLAATAPKGSYAGAMGLPQFMPSSFRQYAADGDADGKRDIWNNPADAIASVASYFSVHGWQPGEPVVKAQDSSDARFTRFLSKDGRATASLGELSQAGVRVPRELPEQAKAAIVSFETEDGPSYWLTLHNFYVITRYNHSPLYALAAHQLAQEILRRHATANGSSTASH